MNVFSQCFGEFREFYKKTVSDITQNSNLLTFKKKSFSGFSLKSEDSS